MNYTDRNLHIERTDSTLNGYYAKEAPHPFLYRLLRNGLVDEVMYQKVYKSP